MLDDALDVLSGVPQTEDVALLRAKLEAKTPLEYLIAFKSENAVLRARVSKSEQENKALDEELKAIKLKHDAELYATKLKHETEIAKLHELIAFQRSEMDNARPQIVESRQLLQEAKTLILEDALEFDRLRKKITELEKDRVVKELKALAPTWAP